MKMKCFYCEADVLARGMCAAHYTRWKRDKDGDPSDRPLCMKNGELQALGLSSKHPFYVAWVNMKTRCDNPKSTQYQWYGGKGIHYCEEWREFRNFHRDMWGVWKLGLTLERKNVDLGYSKTNCTWILPAAQASNRTSCNKYAWGETRHG